MTIVQIFTRRVPATTNGSEAVDDIIGTLS